MGEEALDLAHGIEARFRHIGDTTMAGLPFVNPALDVRVEGPVQVGGEWLFVVLTPWFMNLTLLPVDRDRTVPPTGTKSMAALPGGRFEFIAGHDEVIGAYRACSLFSPMDDFADQDTAIETARQILALVTAGQTGDAEGDDEDADMRAIWEGRLPEAGAAEPSPAEPPPQMSRRRLFGLSGKPAP